MPLLGATPLPWLEAALVNIPRIRKIRPPKPAQKRPNNSQIRTATHWPRDAYESYLNCEILRLPFHPTVPTTVNHESKPSLSPSPIGAAN
jgi:hypothetical protein